MAYPATRRRSPRIRLASRTSKTTESLLPELDGARPGRDDAHGGRSAGVVDLAARGRRGRGPVAPGRRLARPAPSRGSLGGLRHSHGEPRRRGVRGARAVLRVVLQGTAGALAGAGPGPGGRRTPHGAVIARGHGCCTHTESVDMVPTARWRLRHATPPPHLIPNSIALSALPAKYGTIALLPRVVGVAQ